MLNTKIRSVLTLGKIYFSAYLRPVSALRVFKDLPPNLPITAINHRDADESIAAIMEFVKSPFPVPWRLREEGRRLLEVNSQGVAIFTQSESVKYATLKAITSGIADCNLGLIVIFSMTRNFAVRATRELYFGHFFQRVDSISQHQLKILTVE